MLRKNNDKQAGDLERKCFVVLFHAIICKHASMEASKQASKRASKRAGVVTVLVERRQKSVCTQAVSIEPPAT